VGEEGEEEREGEEGSARIQAKRVAATWKESAEDIFVFRVFAAAMRCEFIGGVVQ
jgi:hypothetical protein